MPVLCARRIDVQARAVRVGTALDVVDWKAGGRAAREVASTLSGAGMRAVQAAYESTAFVDNDLLMSLDKVIAHIQNAHAVASGDTTRASRMTELTRQAIGSWRQLAGLDERRARETSSAPHHAQSLAYA